MYNIIIDDNYYILREPRNFTLMKKTVKKRGDNAGKAQEVVIGYFGTIERALNRYFELVQDDLMDGTTISLDEWMKRSYEICTERERVIRLMVRPIEKEMRELSDATQEM